VIIRNLQNIPREKRIKRLIIPRHEDEVIIEADLSQAEGMCVAWKAGETKLIQMYEKGEDIHSFTGSIIMEKKITKEENVSERNIAKRIVHGSNYGMSPMKLSQIILNAYAEGESSRALTIKEAKRAQNIYFQNFPKIRTNYHLGIQRELRENNRVLKTPVGFQRKFYTPYGDELFRQAYAHYAQNIVAFITNTGLNTLAKTSFRSNLYMQTHDSITLSVVRSKKDEAAKLLRQALTYPVYINGRELVIPVDIKWGKNAADTQEMK